MKHVDKLEKRRVRSGHTEEVDAEIRAATATRNQLIAELEAAEKERATVTVQPPNSPIAIRATWYVDSLEGQRVVEEAVGKTDAIAHVRRVSYVVPGYGQRWYDDPLEGAKVIVEEEPQFPGASSEDYCPACGFHR